jgi:hypothetical protein
MVFNGERVGGRPSSVRSAVIGATKIWPEGELTVAVRGEDATDLWHMVCKGLGMQAVPVESEVQGHTHGAWRVSRACNVTGATPAEVPGTAASAGMAIGKELQGNKAAAQAAEGGTNTEELEVLAWNAQDLLFRRGACDTPSADKLGVLQDAIDTRGRRLGAVVISEVRGSIRKFFEKRGLRAWLKEKGFSSKLVCGEGGAASDDKLGATTGGKQRRGKTSLCGGVLLAWRTDHQYNNGWRGAKQKAQASGLSGFTEWAAASSRRACDESQMEENSLSSASME